MSRDLTRSLDLLRCLVRSVDLVLTLVVSPDLDRTAVERFPWRLLVPERLRTLVLLLLVLVLDVFIVEHDVGGLMSSESSLELRQLSLDFDRRILVWDLRRGWVLSV